MNRKHCGETLQSHKVNSITGNHEVILIMTQAKLTEMQMHYSIYKFTIYWLLCLLFCTSSQLHTCIKPSITINLTAWKVFFNRYPMGYPLAVDLYFYDLYFWFIFSLEALSAPHLSHVLKLLNILTCLRPIKSTLFLLTCLIWYVNLIWSLTLQAPTEWCLPFQDLSESMPLPE